MALSNYQNGTGGGSRRTYRSGSGLRNFQASRTNRGHQRCVVIGTAILLVVAWTEMAAITRATGTGPSGMPTPQSVLDLLEVRPDWQAQIAARDGLIHWPISLAFDRGGNAWVVEKSESGGQLYRLSDTDGDGVYDRREIVAAPVQNITSVTAWGDWLYLVGEGRLVRWRSPLADGKPEKETLLEGFGQGSVYCSVAPAGLWLRCGGKIHPPGQPAGQFPRSGDLLLLIRHDSSTVRLAGWSESAEAGPVASDVAGNVWLVRQSDDREPQLFTWHPWTETLQPAAGLLVNQQRPAVPMVDQQGFWADFYPPFFAEMPGQPVMGLCGVRGNRRSAMSGEANVPRTQSVAGLVCDYDAASEAHPPPSLVWWAKVWPAMLAVQRPDRKGFTVGVLVKPPFRVLVLNTALAMDRAGQIFLAGCYRPAGGQVRGFLLRILRRPVNQRSVAHADLHKLDNRQLLERLAHVHPREMLALQEEICRRGQAVIPALVELASTLTESANSERRQPDRDEKTPADLSPLAAKRALRLLTALRPAAARPLGWKLIRHSCPELTLAGIALLRGDRSDETRSALVQLLGERSLEVRRAAALTLVDCGSADNGGGRAAEIAATLGNFLRFYDDHEPAWLDALARGLERCGEAGLATLWELAHSGSQQELALAVLAWTRLYSPSALAQIGKWLDHPHLTHGQRQFLLQWWAQVARCYPVSARPILQWLQNQERLPVALLAAGLQALAAGTGDDGAEIARFAARWLQHEDLTVRLAAIHCCMRHAVALSVRTTLKQLVQENARSPQERLLAAEALLASGDREIQPQLLALLADTSQGAALRERVAILLLIHGDAHIRQQTLGRLADWPADMGQTVVLHLRPEKALLLELARNLQHGNLSTTNREMPWYLRLTRTAPAWLKDALMEALAVWAADDPAAWQVMAVLAENPQATARE